MSRRSLFAALSLELEARNKQRCANCGTDLPAVKADETAYSVTEMNHRLGIVKTAFVHGAHVACPKCRLVSEVRF